MQVFNCPSCGARLYFSNLFCTCGQAVALNPQAARFVPLEQTQPCRNREEIACNWLAHQGAGADGRCRACMTTRTIPDLGVPDNRRLWAEAEQAKRWVMANLMRYGIFMPDDPNLDPVFDLMSEATSQGEAQIMMGHAEGTIIINVAEADPAIREDRRQGLEERFRTMTGHFRHEIGHFIHLRLMAKPGFAEAFRALFGDEREDYAAALQRHYSREGRNQQSEAYITDYASAHPHEDWAETFAHFLHLVEITDTAQAMGLSWAELGEAGEGFDAYATEGEEPLLTVAVSLGLALNQVNRAMGLHDLYPFVLTPTTRNKLGFVSQWIRAASG